jgi:pyridinium-3,5-biscarboxylic acid mononucleotide sulfurtransferase
MRETEEKLEKLKEIIKELESAVIAFSGGCDSSFLAKVAYDVLGDRAIAITANSELYADSEVKDSKKIAADIGIKHEIISSNELRVPGFRDNPPERCYYCKKELFSELSEIAKKRDFKYVLDGSNFDDTDDYRPGMKAGKELNIRSPLREAELNKDEIRQLSRKFGLYTADKPAIACLASRFPYGTRIRKRDLRKVEKAEGFLRELGFTQLRVRHHGNIARIEILPEDIESLLKNHSREKILTEFKNLGYKYVTLDLEGYRTGSMNEVL